ncbi:CHAT domain-containing protein [Intrasporangium sp. YIM S08009]|uniref:CHAT domain-containing protein n=1 Tax=Intrasporangium zincisolvens TaxID=3080018 RepID=UPI002B054C5E|nr:CHAT domain-containing protein [Intrasporangium sp. YIM S08009]
MSDAPDAPDPRPRPTVHVAHGDLRFARNHLIIGHYAGSTLVGGEAALDQLLDGRLSRAAMLGIYPGALETCQVFTDPDKWSTPPGAVVAGLGPIGQLSAASLARAVAHAALTAALGNLSIARPRKASRRTGGVLQMRLSSLLIATGAGGLPVRDSVQALLTGIQRANDRLADTGMGVHICDLEVIELWQDRALQALDAVSASMSTGELAECFVLDPRLREMPGRQRRLVFTERDGWWQQVRVRSESDGSLTFEASVGRAGTPTRTVGTQRALVDRLVESLVDTPSPDVVSAHTLFELLFPNDLKAQAPDTDNIVLVVDRGSAHFPWELLDDHGADRLGSGDGERRTPLGVRRGLVRQLEGTTMRSHVLSATTGRAFVIGDTESGLGPLPAAQNEARAVAKTLQDKGFQCDPLITASGTQVVQGLFDGAYRIVHLAGHGVFDWPVPAAGTDGVDGTARVTGLVLGGGMFLTAGEIGQLRQVPELVFVNCCHLGAVPEGDTAAPTLGGRYHRLAASVATELIDIGVRAVVACGWAVDDEAAATFATTFYDAILAGETFGDAVTRARAETWSLHPDVNTWGAYQCYGDPDYRLAREGVELTAGPTRSLASTEQARVEIENLGQSVDVSRDTNYGLRRLHTLVAQLDACDLSDGALQVLIARTYNKFGNFDLARDYFRRTLASGGTALTVRDFEVWIDQTVRTAATDAVHGSGAPGGSGIALLGADAVETAAATIESSIATLRHLIDDPGSVVLGSGPGASVLTAADAVPAPSIDRLWRVASAYKRLALVTCPARSAAAAAAAPDDWTRAKAALVDAADWYRRAHEAAGPNDRRSNGALANWLAAELALTWRPVPDREGVDPDTARRLLHDATEVADEEARHSPSFWTVAVVGDLVTLAALWAPEPTRSKAAKAVDRYERAALIGSEEQLRQVRDQVDWLSDMANSDHPPQAAFLRTLQEGLDAIG